MSDTTITPEERAKWRELVMPYPDGTIGNQDKRMLRLLDALEQSEASAEKAEAEVARLTKMVDWLAERLAERCEELQCVGSGGSDPCYTGKEECETAENFSFTRCWAACSRIKNEKF